MKKRTAKESEYLKDWEKRGPAQARAVLDFVETFIPNGAEALLALVVAAHSLASVKGLPFDLFVETVKENAPSKWRPS